MRILCITHTDFESPGIIKKWAEEKNYSFEMCKPYLGQNCLNQSDFDLLVIMGGPQSPLEIEKFPYLEDEILLIQQAIAQSKKVLGICLGAQLIGAALGGKTERSPEKEVGVYPITLLPEGMHDPLLEGFPKRISVIHWHNDMPGETADSVVLAYSEGCPRQIIRYAPTVYGFQCHLEINQVGIKKMIESCPGDFKPSTFTKNALEFLDQDFETINGYMIKVLDRLRLL